MLNEIYAPYSVGGREDALDARAIEAMFADVCVHPHWLAKPVQRRALERIYELGSRPIASEVAARVRLVFVVTDSAKSRLAQAVGATAKDQILAAPATVIVCRKTTEASASISDTATDDGLLGAPFVFAARAIGLRVCVASVIDRPAVDGAFLFGTSDRSLFAFGVGEAVDLATRVRPNVAGFDQACDVL